MRSEDLKRMEIFSKDVVTGFPLFGSHRIMLTSMAGLGRLHTDLEKSLGREKLSILFNRFGYEAGLKWASAISKMYDFDTPEDWLKSMAVLLNMAGLARFSIEKIELDVEKDMLSLSGSWRDSFEVALWRQSRSKSKNPVCAILPGIMSGFSSTVLGQEVLVREISCEAEGDGKCLFEGRSAKEWGLDPEAVRARFSVNPLKEELEKLQVVLKQAEKEMEKKNSEISELKRKALGKARTDGILYRSEAMEKAFILAEKVAPTQSTVLVQGESGTGKEVMAGFIHRNSGRSEKPFIAINCAAMPSELLESELFGHTKGAFTGADSDKTGLLEEAGEGTFFLDEVGEIPLELQSKLLRALEEKEIRRVGGVRSIPLHCRIIAATNRDLGDMVKSGEFREDLYYRLAVFPIMVKPLRERRQDILILARHFLKEMNGNHPGFSPEAVRKMATYSWPGNVRELKNWVEYGLILAGDCLISPDHLPLSTGQLSGDPAADLTHDLPTCREMEKRYINMVLEHTGGSKSRAAEILGMSVTTLWRRLKG